MTYMVHTRYVEQVSFQLEREHKVQRGEHVLEELSVKVIRKKL